MEKSSACHRVYADCEKLINDEAIDLSPCRIGMLQHAIGLIMIGAYDRAADLVEQVRKGQMDPAVMKKIDCQRTMTREILKRFLHSVAC